VAAATLAIALLVLVLPRTTGADWRAIVRVWQGLVWWQLLVLAVLWFTGLVAHSSVLIGALPGLSRRRALTLNLTGSAVANVVPLGGVPGTALNYLMVRRWGFTAAQFSLFTVLSNAWSLLTKALLPIVAVAILAAAPIPGQGRLLATAAIGSAVLVTAVAATALAVWSDRGARAAGRVTHALARLARRPTLESSAVTRRLMELRHSASVVVRAGWRRMTLGMVLYYACCALLMWACLHVVGGSLGLLAVLAIFAIERVLTALPITPGGSGVVEVAVTALVIGFGGSAALSAAGVLLYRAFTFGLEIPVGAVWLAGWLLTQRVRRPAPAAGAGVGEAA
jgi:uncharacterized protein (TIRG00374 family)